MTYLLAIFRNRTDTISCYKILQSYRINCTIINTPKQALVACGISVKLSLTDYNRALDIFKRRKFNSFVGFYKVYENGSTYIVNPFFLWKY